MTFERFHELFVEYARATRAFALEFVEGPLPEQIAVDLRLNRSFDGHAEPDEQLFPEDDQRNATGDLRGLTIAAAARQLWRDGAIPAWIDLSFSRVVDGRTILEALCSGRYSANPTRAYYEHGGERHCFRVKSRILTA